MSYILEALRKSDLQRQRGAMPTLQTAPMILAAPKRPSRIYYAAFGAVLLLGAGIMIGWLRPWQPELPAIETSPVVAARAPSAQQGLPVPSLATPETVAVATAAQPGSGVAAMRKDAAAAGKGRAGQASVPMISAPEVSRKEKPGRDAVVPEKPAGEAGTAKERPMAMEELPLQIRQEIPVMAVQLHAYSRIPGDRLVSINFVRLREGGMLAPGLMLEQITPDGMIFSYKGYRFRRGIR